MAITSEIIGKLGGADVEVIPVEGEASGKAGSSEVIATIDIPAGETWLVAAIGQRVGTSTNDSGQPELHLGDVRIPGVGPRGTYGLATTATEPVSFTIVKKTSTPGSDTFTGHVYTVKM